MYRTVQNERVTIPEVGTLTKFGHETDNDNVLSLKRVLDFFN